MAIVITQSDCDFLVNTYKPTGKVEMRLKSILVKLGVGYMEMSRDVIKDVEINGSVVDKVDNKIVLGALALPEYVPVDDNTSISDLSKDFKYIPTLTDGGKIPSQFIPASVITDIYPYEVNPETFQEETFWTDLATWLKTQDPLPEKGDIVVIIAKEKGDENKGSYFLNAESAEDLTGTEEEIKKCFVPITDPIGHIEAIIINGKTYSDRTGVLSLNGIDFVNVVESLSDGLTVESVKDSEAGIVTSSISLKEASDTVSGSVKIKMLDSEDTDVITLSEKAILKIKEELIDELNAFKNEVSVYNTPVEVSFPLEGVAPKGAATIEITEGLENIDVSKCSVKLYRLKMNGYEKEEFFATITKYTTEKKIVVSMVLPEEIERGGIIVVIKN